MNDRVAAANARLVAVCARVSHLQEARAARKIGRLIQATDATPSEAAAIVGLALTEMSARPIAVRFIEWCCVVPLRSGLFGQRLHSWARRRTVGPLQMQGAAFRLRVAVPAAIGVLRAGDVDLDSHASIARYWHGPQTDRAAPVSYARVLEHAMNLAGTEES